jgi:hypothetical protein
MLIRLLKDWSLYSAGQVIDVYGGVGKDLIAKGIGYNAEKPLPIQKPIPKIKEKGEKTVETAVEDAGEGKYTPEPEKSIVERKKPTHGGHFGKIKE